jgi:phosphatidylglycerol:prolipoprotein diacylglycerol transferase
MRQVLFHIPLHSIFPSLPDVPVYGYGAMLFLAFVFCTWLATWLARREKVPPQAVQDLAIWVFISGIIGARITFMIQYRDHFDSLLQFFAVWDGGLVFYGSFLGGAVGTFLAYRLVLRKRGLRLWQILDICAPCLALGLALGRIGCLLNGCCYGNVACPDCPAISFPLSAASRFVLTGKGYQTAAGFTMDDRPGVDGRTVGAIEKDSEAERFGLRTGDVITKVQGKEVRDYSELADLLTRHWERGVNRLALTVRRGSEEVELEPFRHWTLGLHPTQLYESISMVLLLFVLLAYYPFRRREGQLIAIFMIAYAVHRFLNEILRNDTERFADGMTLSQNLSLPIFVGGVVLVLWLWRQPRTPPGDVRSVGPLSAAAPQTAAPV